MYSAASERSRQAWVLSWVLSWPGLEGFGLAQLAENVISENLRQGKLVEVLADWQPPSVPVTMLYPHQRFLSPAVRAFADWVGELFNDVAGEKRPSR